MQMRYKTYEDEYELRCLERELAAELGVPYVRCGYDADCSHKAGLTDELNYRREYGVLNKNEYVINYEIYDTKEEYDNKYKGGSDGEVHELIYTTTKGTVISVKDYDLV